MGSAMPAGAGGDMLVAGGFCYRMLAWPTDDPS
jgi:hypothetical protein